jgi:hypothetical protein
MEALLSQPPGDLKELHIDGIRLDDELTWLLIESCLESLFLRNYIFDSDSSIGFKHILEFLNPGDWSKSCFKLGIQLNGCIARWIICNEPSSLVFVAIRPITLLVFFCLIRLLSQLFGWCFLSGCPPIMFGSRQTII